MRVFIDQTARNVSLQNIPRRIISLVPSQTELLFGLGLEEEVVGITKFCVHPSAWFSKKTKVGGTKQLKLEIITDLKPDLIIANKEENVKEQVEWLAEKFPVWVSDVNSLEDAYDMIGSIGGMTNRVVEAGQLVSRIRQNFASLPFHASKPGLDPDDRYSLHPRPRTAYLIWRNPYMTVGGDTFIHHMLETAGFDNVFKDRKRYPEITLNELEELGCELILLSSEPFPFGPKHVTEIKDAGTQAKLLLVDGEMFSWYGSRLLYAPHYFRNLNKMIGFNV
ncbi:MAG TPA: helical backbone metal receptor [Chitinophagaceae bacterium]|nr:helical backbone metal receptor [Chitinophagaceae bacterium]